MVTSLAKARCSRGRVWVEVSLAPEAKATTLLSNVADPVAISDTGVALGCGVSEPLPEGLADGDGDGDGDPAPEDSEGADDGVKQSPGAGASGSGDVFTVCSPWALASGSGVADPEALGEAAGLELGIALGEELGEEIGDELAVLVGAGGLHGVLISFNKSEGE